MTFIEILFLILIPALPLVVGLRSSLAPFGGPLLLVSVQLFLGVTLKSVYLLFHQELFSKHLWLARSVSSYETALVFMLLFALLICIGYGMAKFLEKNRYSAVVARPVRLSKEKSFALLLIAVSTFVIVAFLFIRARGLLGQSAIETVVSANATKVDRIEGVSNYGSTNAFIALFFVIPKICFFVFYSNVVTKAKSFTIKLGFAATSVLIFLEILLRGKRDALASLFISMLIMTSLIKKKFSLREIKQYSLFIVVSILLFSTISAIRGSGDAYTSVSNLNYTEHLLHPIAASTYFADINILASIIERMPHLQYLQGDSYLSLFSGFIPRAFWPDKPAISLGLFVKSVVLQSPGTLGGIPPTMPGESFINFGWLGLTVGFLYGLFLRKFEVFLLSGKLAATGIGFYIYSIWMVPLTWTLVQSSFAIAMNGVIVSLVLVYPLLNFITKPDKRVKGTHSMSKIIS